MQSPEEQARPEAPMRYADASNRRITSYNAIDYAYRDLGVSEVPLVLLQHFRGNLDNWDPALIDALAADRRVVAFDNVGVAGTSGTTPNTVEAMAHGAIAFIEAMSFERVDLASQSAASSRRRSRSSARICCGASCSRPPHHRVLQECMAGHRK
jgi:pimeloyl-ACP methyl ester carboxylesterase